MSAMLNEQGLDYRCPGCGQPLTAGQNAQGVYWSCPACDGRLVSLAVLRKTVLREAVNAVWQQTNSDAGRPGRACPACGLAMTEAHVTTGGVAMDVDVCHTCTLVWFDPREYGALPPKPDEPKVQEPELSPEAREAMAVAMVQGIGERYRSQSSDEMPESGWQVAAGLFGLPVETDAPELLATPWATWLVVAAVVAISSAAFYYGDAVVQRYALIPAQAGRYGGTTLLTSFFLHGGIVHLLGNMYFLLVFGDNVEDYLGMGRYLLLLLLATLVGGLAHIAVNPASTIPCIGASGGIAGVLSCYALACPHARVSLLFRSWYFFRWISLPAWGMLLLWIGLQLIGAWQQVQGLTNVSAFAHLGGAATGVLCWLLWRRQCGEQS